MPPKKKGKDLDLFHGPDLTIKEVWKGPMESFLDGVAAESLKEAFEEDAYDKIFGIPPKLLNGDIIEGAPKIQTFSGKKPEFIDPNLGSGVKGGLGKEWAPVGKDKALEKLLQMVKAQTFMTMVQKLFKWDAAQKAWFLKDDNNPKGLILSKGVSGELMAQMLQDIKGSPFWPDVTYYNDLAGSIKKALMDSAKGPKGPVIIDGSSLEWPLQVPSLQPKHYHDEGPLYSDLPDHKLFSVEEEDEEFAAALAKDILSNPKGTRLNWESPQAQYALQKIIDGKILAKHVAKALGVDPIKVKYYVRRRARASGQKLPWKARKKKGTMTESGKMQPSVSAASLEDAMAHVAEAFDKTAKTLAELKGPKEPKTKVIFTVDQYGDVLYQYEEDKPNADKKD